MNTQEYIAHVNKLRLANKDKWAFCVLMVNGIEIRHKFHNTWNQVLEIKGVRHGGNMGLNISQWKKEIESALTYNMES